MPENKAFFYRNDQHKILLEFDPSDPESLDKVGFKYFGRTLAVIEKELKDSGIIFCVTAWTVHELPIYGQNVISFILQDEWARVPRYQDKVKMIFRTCGKFPFNTQSYRYGGAYEKVSNLLGQTKSLLKDGSGRISNLWKYTSGKNLAPVYEIPLGCYAYDDVPYIPIQQRTNDLFFAGSYQHLEGKGVNFKRPKELARRRMQIGLQNLSKSHPNTNIEQTNTGSFKNSVTTNNRLYLQSMMNTKICPIPRGANLETFRFYEAIRYGCIPIGEAFPSGWFYDNAPIIRLSSWDDLSKQIPELLSDEKKLLSHHQKALSWWKDKCSEEALAKYIIEEIKKLL